MQIRLATSKDADTVCDFNVRLARDFSQLVAAFTDADHLRIDEISPPAASRRPSRVRAGGESVALPIAAGEGTVHTTYEEPWP